MTAHMHTYAHTQASARTPQTLKDELLVWLHPKCICSTKYKTQEGIDDVQSSVKWGLCVLFFSTIHNVHYHYNIILKWYMQDSQTSAAFWEFTIYGRGEIPLKIVNFEAFIHHECCRQIQINCIRSEKTSPQGALFIWKGSVLVTFNWDR